MNLIKDNLEYITAGSMFIFFLFALNHALSVRL